MFENAEIRIPCPACGVSTKKTISWIKSNSKLTCSSCHERIDVKKDGLLKGLAEADKEIENFQKSIQRINKQLSR